MANAPPGRLPAGSFIWAVGDLHADGVGIASLYLPPSWPLLFPPRPHSGPTQSRLPSPRPPGVALLKPLKACPTGTVANDPCFSKQLLLGCQSCLAGASKTRLGWGQGAVQDK